MQSSLEQWRSRQKGIRLDVFHQPLERLVQLDNVRMQCITQNLDQEYTRCNQSQNTTLRNL